MHINAPVPRLMFWRASDDERSQHQNENAPQHKWQVPPDSHSIKSPSLHQFPSSQSDFLPSHYQPARPTIHQQIWPAPSTTSSSSTSPEPCTQQRGLKRQREEIYQPYRPHHGFGLVHHQGYQPLSALRTTQQQNRAKCSRFAFQRYQNRHQQQARRVMYGNDEWAFMEGVDGDLDSYEIRPLQNELPSGTASSPFSRPDGPAMTLPGRDQLASPREPYYFDFVNGPNDGFPGLTADYSSSGLSDMHSIPDLSMFSSSFGMPPTMMQGMPIQGAGTYAASTSCANTGPGLAYGSLPSSSSCAPYGESSFGSMGRGPGGEDGVNTAGQMYSANGVYAGAHIAGLWSAASSDNSHTMSPHDISFKPDPSPVPSPPSLLPLRDENEEDQLPACKSEVSSAPADSSPSKKQRNSSGVSTSTTKTRKSLPDKALRPRKAPQKQDPAKHDTTTPLKSQSRRTPSKPKPEPTSRKTLLSPLMPAPLPKRPSEPLRAPVRQQPAPDARAPRRPAPHASRAEKNEYLLACRARGITYSEIRAAGGFTEAESTLRGKVRALTKSKEERVRKPQWTDKDIELLLEGVRAYAAGRGVRGAVKVPWKRVAEFIHEKGGTYRFGYATCRKKWDELMEEEGDEDEDDV